MEEVVSAQEPNRKPPRSASGSGLCANLTSVRSTRAPGGCTGRGWFRACEKCDNQKLTGGGLGGGGGDLIVGEALGAAVGETVGETVGDTVGETVVGETVVGEVVVGEAVGQAAGTLVLVYLLVSASQRSSSSSSGERKLESLQYSSFASKSLGISPHSAGLLFTALHSHTPTPASAQHPAPSRAGGGEGWDAPLRWRHAENCVCMLCCASYCDT
jgi:hypothetical protein